MSRTNPSFEVSNHPYQTDRDHIHQPHPSSIHMGVRLDRGSERQESRVNNVPQDRSRYLWDLGVGASTFPDPVQTGENSPRDDLTSNRGSFSTYSISNFGQWDAQGSQIGNNLAPGVGAYISSRYGSPREGFASTSWTTPAGVAQPVVNNRAGDPEPLSASSVYHSNTKDMIDGHPCRANDSTDHIDWGYNSYGSYTGGHSFSGHSANVFMSEAYLQGYPSAIAISKTTPHNRYTSESTAAQPLYQPTTGALITNMGACYNASGQNAVNDASIANAGYGHDSYQLPALSGVQHSSCESSNMMAYRSHRQGIRTRPTPYSNTYHQQKSRAPIYNGDIHGGVQAFQGDFNTFNFYNSDAAILQYLKEHAATGAMHDSDERFPPPLCHPGTREAVIYRILDWYGYQQGPGKPIMWVHAPAGFGKTAVAGTVAEKLEEKLRELGFNPVGATFFFWRTSPERNSPARFIITLVYQLMISIPELAPHIESAVKRNPMILKKALELQLMKLIVEPFKVLGDATNMPRRLAIIDGIDECINSIQETQVEKTYAEDREIVQIRVLNLIYLLASHQLPLSFLILSRPEAWLKQHIKSPEFKDVVETVDLYEVGDNMKDVEKFVREELSALNIWEEQLIQCFLTRASGHMVFASTIIRHIKNPYSNPQHCLQNILDNHSSSSQDLANSHHLSSLHKLYRQILQSCPDGNHPVMIQALEEVMFFLAYTYSDECPENIQKAITVADHLSGRLPGSGIQSLRGLHSVLSLEDDWPNLFHSSFSEFLKEPGLSKQFFVDKEKGRIQLLQGCLNCVSSITLQSTVPIEEHVSFALSQWMWIWWDWCENKEWKPDAMAALLEMYKQLLRVDLMSYFVLLFTSTNLQLPGNLWSKSAHNLIIPNLTSRAEFYSSEPLAQQAVTHVVSAVTAAILHLLWPDHLNADQWSEAFYSAVGEYIYSLQEPLDDVSVDWRSNVVVQALETLRQDSPTLWVHLRDRALKCAFGGAQEVWDYIDADSEEDEEEGEKGDLEWT